MNTRSREQLIAWGFLSPALVILIAFGLFPIGYAFYVSLHKWQIKLGALIGLDHYRRTLGEPQNLLFFIAGLALVWAAYRLRTTLRGRGQPRRRRRPAQGAPRETFGAKRHPMWRLKTM